jgi:hypothetical protein
MFFWKDARETQHEGIGLTRDLSIRGAYILTTSPPPLKASLELKAFLPPRNANLPLRFYGQGQVVRVESAHGRHRAGFAVAAEPFVLRRGEAYR